jgi:hypothetical protein
MNEQEARKLLAEQLNAYRRRPYAELSSRIGTDHQFEVVGLSGVAYQIEIQFLWDDQPNGNLRVLGSIDDGGLRAFFPLCRSFILASDGMFVGEGAV